MASDFAGFNFLQAALHPVSDIRRGYGLGGTAAPEIRRGYGLGDTAAPDIRRGYGLGGAATPDTGAHASGVASGSATTVDTTQHSASTYLALPQS